MTALPAASVQAETREQEGRQAPVFQQTQDLHQAERVMWLHQTLERLQHVLHQMHEVARERLREITRRQTLQQDHERQVHREREQHRLRQGMSLSR